MDPSIPTVSKLMMLSLWMQHLLENPSLSSLQIKTFDRFPDGITIGLQVTLVEYPVERQRLISAVKSLLETLPTIYQDLKELGQRRQKKSWTVQTQLGSLWNEYGVRIEITVSQEAGPSL